MPRPKRLQARAVRRNGRELFLVDLRPFGGRRRLFNSAPEAQAALLQAQLRQVPKPGTRGCNPDMTVAEVAARFLQAKQRKAGQTYRRYENDLRVHLLPRFGAWPWRSLDRGSAYAFLDELRAAPIVSQRRGLDGRLTRVTLPGKRRAPATIRGVLATLSALASFAMDVCQITDHNLFLRLASALDLKVTTASRRAHAAKKTLTPAQVERLLTRAVEAGTWLFPLLVCVLRAGLRIGELLALRLEDVDFTTPGHETLRVARARTTDRTGTVVVDDPKTEAGRRTLLLSPTVVAVLRRWVEVDRPAWKLQRGWRTLPPWLFFADVDPATYPADDAAAGLLDPGNVRRAIRRLTTALHAEDVANELPSELCFPAAWTPHGGRHTVATHLLQAGRPADSVRQLLGHESIRTTADVYGRGGDPEATAGLLAALDALAPVPAAAHDVVATGSQASSRRRLRGAPKRGRSGNSGNSTAT
jgi:integrase